MANSGRRRKEFGSSDGVQGRHLFHLWVLGNVKCRRKGSSSLRLLRGSHDSRGPLGPVSVKAEGEGIIHQGSWVSRGSGCFTPKYATLAFWFLWIKGTWEIASTKRTVWPSLSPYSPGDNLPWERQQRDRGYPYHQREGIYGQEDCINKPYQSFTILLPQAQTSLSMLHKFIVPLSKRYKNFLLWWFEFHIFTGPPYIQN